MSIAVDYNHEREDNIVKNIAKEIVLEAIQGGVEVSQELADYLVKLKLLDSKNGFTAAEVMPRSLTQQLVAMVVEDLKQDTPSMNCIKMQVYWNCTNLNITELKKEFFGILAERSEQYMAELMSVERDDVGKMSKLLANYILVANNLGSIHHQNVVKETVAAIHSVFKNKDASPFFQYSDEKKMEEVKELAKKVTGIRLYICMIGKGGEGIEDVSFLTNVVESFKEDVISFMEKMSARIRDIREIISGILVTDFFKEEVVQSADIFLPPECDITDLIYLKKVLVIMLQHSVYLRDVISKLEEIDGNGHFYLKEFNETLDRLQATIRDREAVPTIEVYDDFSRAGELWLEIQSYFYCLETVTIVTEKLEEFNKKDYFIQSYLEKVINLPPRSALERQDSVNTVPSTSMIVEDEDFYLEFRGFCAWTLFHAEGFLLSGNPSMGISQYKDQYYAFSTNVGFELWKRDPEYYLRETWEVLRNNPELVELLNVYDTLYSVKDQQFVREVDRKIPTRTEEVQTVTHPIPRHWDANYTFNEWEHKKRAMTLARLLNCVTTSAQTVNHSHFRSSIGVLAAPDKDKEVQTKKDSSCGSATVSNYLYGLRGHKENKFKVFTLTRSEEEGCIREVIQHKADPCKKRQKKVPSKGVIHVESCDSVGALCDYTDYMNDYDYYCNAEE